MRSSSPNADLGTSTRPHRARKLTMPIGELPDPPGGFKDAQRRVKRQAARFRVYAHHDDGSVEEITDAAAEISWTVHPVNRKATFAGRGNSEPAGDLAIDPGPRTLTGFRRVWGRWRR